MWYSFHLYFTSYGEFIKRMLNTRTFGNIQENFSTEAAVLKCIPSNFFLEICRSFRVKSEKLTLENCVLPYHAGDKDQAKILQTVFPKFFVVFASYINWNHEYTTHRREVRWIQPYILTRMVARPVNLNFWKSGECGFCCLKNREILT